MKEMSERSIRMSSFENSYKETFLFQVVYESLVKPHNQITNYLTKYSGITEKMLQNVHKRIEDVQDDLIKLLPADAILVGHSLNTDLHAIKVKITLHFLL